MTSSESSYAILGQEVSLGSVDKARSGLAAGVLNSTRQTGSVVGVALFGSLLGGGGDFVRGAHIALALSALLLIAACAIIWLGSRVDAHSV